MITKLNQWLTLLANFGVVVGILFLIIEVGQNTESLNDSRRLAIAQAYQLRSEDTIGMLIGFVESDLAGIQQRLRDNGWPDDEDALNKVSLSDRTNFTYLMTARWTHFDNIHYQYQQGFIDNEFYNSEFVDLVRIFGSQWEAAGRPGPSRPSFIAEVERILYEQQ